MRKSDSPESIIFPVKKLLSRHLVGSCWTLAFGILRRSGWFNHAQPLAKSDIVIKQAGHVNVRVACGLAFRGMVESERERERERTGRERKKRKWEVRRKRRNLSGRRLSEVGDICVQPTLQ